MTLLYALIALPALGAAGAAAHRRDAYRGAWLVVIATLHLGLTAAAWVTEPPPALGGWLAFDAIGQIVLAIVSVLFAMTAVYAVGYLRRENPRGGRAFVSCLLAFLAATSLVALSHHFALMWVGLEATTLAVAPLIYHRHDRRSLNAVWKYLMLSSVGIALALLGTFLLAAAQPAGAGTGQPLLLEDLMTAGTQLHAGWLKAASVFLLVGFGTKMGLVPLHFWKPDTYGEAPSLVAALMAGGLTACAFLGVLRTTEVVIAAGQGAFLTPLLLGFGLVSLGIAALVLIGQGDLKRLLAWSSVEHMGLLVLGLGLGGSAVYGALLHAISNGLAKGLLFLTAGNIALQFGASGSGRPTGLLRSQPVSGVLLVAGLFAVTGSPPFGTFVSEFTIVRGAFAAGHPAIGALTVLSLVVAFLGVARLFVSIAFGPSTGPARAPAESGWLLVGPAVLAGLLLLLGLWIPPLLRTRLADAAAVLGGYAP